MVQEWFEWEDTADMTAIRNACVARGTAPAGAATRVYTVPAGYVLLLKDITLGGSTGISMEYTARAVSEDSATYVSLWDDKANTTGVSHWVGWIALNGGDWIQISMAGGPAFYWISGALLPYAEALPTTA